MRRLPQKRLESTYHRLRTQVRKIAAQPTAEEAVWLDYLLVLPDLFHLTANLLLDKQVPKKKKLVLSAAVLYILSPVDIIPDVVPVLGQVDDLVVLLKALSYFFDQDDPQMRAAVERHWAGHQDVFIVINEALQFLNRRINVLPEKWLRRVDNLLLKAQK